MSDELKPENCALPCDIKFGHVTFRKGVSLSLVAEKLEQQQKELQKYALIELAKIGQETERTDERAEMQAAIVELRLRLADCRKEFWDDWHSCMSEEQFKEQWIIEDIDRVLNNTKKWSE